MKKLIFILAFSLSQTVNAQNYLISFTGTGASTSIVTVKVENLMKGTTLIINGSDILRLTGATGINPVEDNKSSKLKIYPNPMTDNSTLEVFPPVSGNAVITVYEMTGKPVIQIQSNLEDSRQDFRISGIKNGLYIINVKGNNYQFSGILLSNSKSGGTIRIEKVNSNIQTVDEKKEIIYSKGTLATIDMAYSTGDRLKFTGISSTYSTVKTDIPASDKIINFNFIACTDGDNNSYPVVEIGTQIWMAENLKTTRYNNGQQIPEIADYNTWLAQTNMAYCWYNNDAASFKETYGALYNWYAVEGKVINPFKPWFIWYMNICPTGWHVPNDGDWTILTNYLGGENAAGGKLRETGSGHWESPNTRATNEAGFSALPGGGRSSLYPSMFMGTIGIWWSSTKSWDREIPSNATSVLRIERYPQNGQSIRCLKN